MQHSTAMKDDICPPSERVLQRRRPKRSVNYQLATYSVNLKQTMSPVGENEGR